MKGCKNCPAYAKCTVTYRGSACSALRSTYGIDTDPEIITNADRIRAMSDGELAEQLVVAVNGLQPCTLYYSIPTERTFLTEAEAVRVTLEWLQQPAERK